MRDNRLKEIVLNNGKLKLLAAGLAILVFYAVRGVIGFEVPFDIPIKVEVGEGIAILDQPKTIKVTFRGSQEDLRRLNYRDIIAVIRPKATDPAGSEKVTIKPKDIDGAYGARVVNIDPRIVTIAFDREIEKVVAVAKPQVIGSPLVGKVELDYQPQTVKIRGSNLRLKNKEEISTEPIDVDGRVESFSKTVRILPLRDAFVSRIQPAEVTVNVNIVTESVTREWKNIIVRGIVAPGFSGTMRFVPDLVTISLKGRMEEIDNVASNTVMAFVDCADAEQAGVTNLPVKVFIPAGIDVEAVAEPSAVKVMFRDK